MSSEFLLAENKERAEGRKGTKLIHVYSSELTLYSFYTVEQAKWTSPSYQKSVMRTERLLLAMFMESQDLVGIIL